MKIFLLSLFVAAAFAAPAPLDEDTGEPVELIVNGVAEGEPLEIGDVLGIKVKQHINGEIVSATDLLHPLTAVGIEEVAAANNPNSIDVIEVVEVDEIKPEPVELPPPVIPEGVPNLPINPPVQVPDYVDIPVVPEVVPEPIELPEPVFPEINPPVDVLPEPGELPDPIMPEIELPVEDLPEAGPQFPNGEVFNNGVVQVSLNAHNPGVISSIQSWFSMVLNYFNGYEVTTHQIV